MTSEQLRSIFHVESQDLVPNYEVIHLTHHGTTEHRISKRSIATASHQNHQFVDASAQQKFSSHHVKKDLSKSAYYSELKKEASSLPVSSSSSSKWTTSKSPNSLSNRSNSINHSFSSDSQSKLVKNILSDSEFDEENEHQRDGLPSVPQRRDENDDSDSYEQTKRNSFANIDLGNIKEHNVSLSVFGQVFNLTLRPTDQLFKNGPQSLQMFTVNASPNSTHGLDYEPVKDVSVFAHVSLPLSLCIALYHFAFECELCDRRSLLM